MKTSAVWPLISVAIEREDIAVDVIHQNKVPDEKWRFVDKAGHGHFWKGKKLPHLQARRRWQAMDRRRVRRRRGRHQGVAVQDLRSDHRTRLSTQLAPTPRPRSNLVTVTISDEEFVFTPEQYAESVEGWLEATRQIQGR